MSKKEPRTLEQRRESAGCFGLIGCAAIFIGATALWGPAAGILGVGIAFVFSAVMDLIALEIVE